MENNRYQMLNRIGEGVHGVVIKAIDVTNNKFVAIKKVPLKTKYGGISPNTVREIKTLQHCDCENIVTLLDIYPDISGLSIVCEFIPFTLYSKLRDESNPIERKEIKYYMKMLLRGLKYLHGLRIMHRDIKPSNLLITENGKLKIADFGLARIYQPDDLDKSYSPQVASRWYRPPEILWGSTIYGPSIDMWATGCVFAEMLRGESLFPGNTDIEQLALVVRTLGTPSTRNWPDVTNLPDYNKIRFPESKGERWEDLFPTVTSIEEISLVSELVVYNPIKRLTASEALNHEYFNGS